MEFSQIILLLIILIPTGLLLFTKNKLIKLDTKYPLIFTLFALSCFLYFIFGRYIFDLINFFGMQTNDSVLTKSILNSKVFLLDLCPLVAFTLPLLIFFDKQRYFSKWIAPITCIGAVITLFGQIIWEAPDNLFEFIFIGEEPNRLYFMMHFLSLLLSIWTLQISKQFELKEFLYVILVLIIWLFYVLIMKNFLGVISNATGLVEYDWISEYGQYHKVYTFWKLDFPWL
ncbi:MAG: DUF5378 family protein, partial [Mycoplasma sp.]